jgi:hypothetical protein
MKNPNTITSNANKARRALFAGFLAGAALVGVAERVIPAASHYVAGTEERKHKYTTEQLSQMEQEQVVVEPGDGPEKIISSLEPYVSNDPRALQDVKDYITNQGLVGSEDQKRLQAHQQVLVPIVPPSTPKQ